MGNFIEPTALNGASFDAEQPCSARAPTREEIDEESRRVRRLRIVVNLSLSLIAQGDLPLSEAQQMAAAARHLAEELFPGKGDVYDLVYRPQFRRLINELYRLQ